MMTDEELRQHIGPGWLFIAKSVLTILDIHDFELLQIKEKFGGLRIYVKAPSTATPGVKDAIYAILLAAENASLKTCEECGKEGSKVLIRDYWWKTRCAECATK